MGSCCTKCPFIVNEVTLIVVRNHEGKWLVVNETKNRGWSLPGGHVDPPEQCHLAAVREVKEEAGIDVELKGTLREEYQAYCCGFQKRKTIFYAEPIDREQRLKPTADEHSLEARWVTVEELLELKNSQNGWRRPDLYNWAQYIENGGAIHRIIPRTRVGDPVSMIKSEINQI